MTQLTNARAWLRAIPGWSEDEQEADVRAWCGEHGMRVAVYRASDMTRESYIRALRETEAAVLPRIDLIVTPPGKRVARPTAEFAKLLDAVRARSALVVDIWHKARSDDAKSWDSALDAALKRIGSRRKPMPKRKAREMQEASVRARNGKSVLGRWHGLKDRDAKEYRQARAVYKSREFANAFEARAALPEELHGVSRESLDRLFGGRTK